MKISSDTIGYRTRHLPACSALHQPTAPLRFVAVRTSNLIYCALFSRSVAVSPYCQRDPSSLHRHTEFLFSGEIEQIMK